MRPRGDARTAPEVVLPADRRDPVRCLARERLRLAAFATAVACAARRAVHGVLARAGATREHRRGGDLGRDRGWRDGAGRRRDDARRAAGECRRRAGNRGTEVDKAEEKATEQPQTVEVAREETAPEQKTEQPKAERQSPKSRRFETAAAPQEPAQAEQKPAVAMVETPAPDTATAKPQETPPPPPTEVTLLPQPEEKPVEKKPEPKPVQAAPPKPVKDAKPAKEPRRIAAPTRENAGARGQGLHTLDRSEQRGRRALGPATRTIRVSCRRICAATSNIPSDARSRGDQGTATVSFGLDGGGRVTSARLARGSGVASIDQEVQAMVRRASPFPAPPDGRPRSFTVPVAFRLN